MAVNQGQHVEAPSRRYACLGVDDYPSVLDALAEILSPQYVFYRAENGLAAFRSLGRHLIDVVLLDLKLPDLDGLEVLRRIRVINPALPVIVVTAYRDHQALIEASNLGISGYLEKPFNNNVLLEKVRSALSWVMISRADYGHANGHHSTDAAAAAAQIIQKQYAEDLTVQKIASTLHTSPRQMSGAFRREYGQTIRAYIISVRTAEAVKLLRSSDLSIKAIAYSVGYHSLDKFHRHFLHLTGHTPQAFRRLRAT